LTCPASPRAAAYLDKLRGEKPRLSIVQLPLHRKRSHQRSSATWFEELRQADEERSFPDGQPRHGEKWCILDLRWALAAECRDRGPAQQGCGRALGNQLHIIHLGNTSNTIWHS
jgi:hypothetical protein